MKAVVVTGRGMGAIAVVVVAGNGARRAVGQICAGNKVAPMKTGEVLRTRIVDGAQTLDDGLVVRTQEDRFELHLHGGVAVVETVIAALQRAGAGLLSAQAAVDQGLFGKALEGEVTGALSSAVTMTAARLLAGQVEGGLTTFARRCGEQLQQGAELWQVQSRVQWVLFRSQRLMGLLQPRRIAIVGAPDVGKSTLANALLGRTASITSDIAGTTRDWVESSCQFSASSGRNDSPANVPVILVDTAGLRETGDPLEAEAIGRTHDQVRAAELVVAVLDGSRNISPEEAGMVDRYLRAAIPAVVVVNKVDAAAPETVAEARQRWGGAVEVSALRAQGLEPLMQRVLAQLDLLQVGQAEPFAFTRRQQELLRRAAAAADAAEMRRLLQDLLL